MLSAKIDASAAIQKNPWGCWSKETNSTISWPAMPAGKGRCF